MHKQAKDPNGYVRAMDFAIAYAWGKDKDKTIEYLNKAYDERDSAVAPTSRSIKLGTSCETTRDLRNWSNESGSRNRI